MSRPRFQKGMFLRRAACERHGNCADAVGDLNGDGNLSNGTYPGIGNVLMNLYSDPNGDGNPADGTLLATTYTNASGGYQFPGLPAGNYVVIETNPAGATSTVAWVGGLLVVVHPAGSNGMKWPVVGVARSALSSSTPEMMSAARRPKGGQP